MMPEVTRAPEWPLVPTEVSTGVAAAPIREAETKDAPKSTAQPHVWTPPASGLVAWQEMQRRHHMESTNLLVQMRADSRDKNGDVPSEDASLGWNGAVFMEARE